MREANSKRKNSLRLPGLKRRQQKPAIRGALTGDWLENGRRGPLLSKWATMVTNDMILEF